MKERIASYKIPKQIYFWGALPKSAYGKITKKLMRAELEARGSFPQR
jgi:acyl-coenzyme A synthetase/AMP-(fatty) acid ligase